MEIILQWLHMHFYCPKNGTVEGYFKLEKIIKTSSFYALLQEADICKNNYVSIFSIQGFS